MQPRRIQEESVRPFELSLRIRHPSVDPAEISKALELEPEHCFKAGTPRREGARRGAHPQTYWIAPIEMERLRQDDPIMGAMEDRALEERGLSADHVAAVTRSFREARAKHGSFNLEALLFALLSKLNLRQEFLARLQRESGEISVIVVADPAALRNFNLSLPITRFLAKLNIELEFEFDSGN